MNVSMCRASFAGRCAATSKPFTSPAIWQAKAAASKRVIRPIPDLPATRLLHASSTVFPTGQMMPSPVTTTLRRDTTYCRRLRLRVRLDVVDRLLDGGDLLRLFVRDLGFELFLQGHHQFHRVERIRAEVVDE